MPCQSQSIGQTLIASGCSPRSARAGITTRFITAADLMFHLSVAKAQGRVTDSMNRTVIGHHLLAVDQLGKLPFGREEVDPFFRVIAKPCECSSTIAFWWSGRFASPRRDYR
jgi:DNA replication protein DnaC